MASYVPTQEAGRSRGWGSIPSNWTQLGPDIRTEQRVGQEARSDRLAAHADEDGERGNHKGMCFRDQLGEAGADRVRVEEVHQPVGSGLDGIACLPLGQDVHHRELAPRVCGCDQPRQRAPRKHRERLPHRREVVVDDLDVVGAFGNARVHERRGVRRVRDRGDRGTAHLGWMTRPAPRRQSRLRAHVGHSRRIRGANGLDALEARPRHSTCRGPSLRPVPRTSRRSVVREFSERCT
jgi:hypothetical protein